MQVPHFIQVSQQDRQVSRQGDEPSIIGLGILSLQPDKARFQINAIPGQLQDFRMLERLDT